MDFLEMDFWKWTFGNGLLEMDFENGRAKEEEKKNKRDKD
jgi:hypothetical protein